MNRLPTAAIAALLMVGGAWLLLRAVRRRPTSVAELHARLFHAAPARFVPGNAVAPSSTRMGRFGERLAGTALGRRLGGTLGTDLLLIDTTMPEVMAKLVAGVVIATVVGVLCGLVLVGLGLFAPGPGWLIVPPLAALGGFAMMWSDTRGKTRTARRELRQSVNDFVQLVAVCLTTHRSIEEATTFASRAGEGKGFDILRSALETAPQMGVTTWEALDTVGHTYDVAELRDLSGSVERQANIGVGVVETVTQMAASMRARALDELQRAADQTDSNLVLPTTMFVFGMILFLAYPLAVRISSSFGG